MDLLEDAVAVTEDVVAPASHRVYVGNLSWGTDANKLKEHMAGFVGEGFIKGANIFMERSGRSKGCGIVEFETAEAAATVMAEANDTELEGRLIFVREDREPPRARSNGGRQLFVRNLPYSTTWQALKDWVRSADVGDVLRADVLRNRDNTSKGVGTVLMSTEEAAEAAIQALDGQEMDGRPVSVQLDKYA